MALSLGPYLEETKTKADWLTDISATVEERHFSTSARGREQDERCLSIFEGCINNASSPKSVINQRNRSQYFTKDQHQREPFFFALRRLRACTVRALTAELRWPTLSELNFQESSAFCQKMTKLKIVFVRSKSFVEHSYQSAAPDSADQARTSPWRGCIPL